MRLNIFQISLFLQKLEVQKIFNWRWNWTTQWIIKKYPRDNRNEEWEKIFHKKRKQQDLHSQRYDCSAILASNSHPILSARVSIHPICIISPCRAVGRSIQVHQGWDTYLGFQTTNKDNPHLNIHSPPKSLQYMGSKPRMRPRDGESQPHPRLRRHSSLWILTRKIDGWRQHGQNEDIWILTCRLYSLWLFLPSCKLYSLIHLLPFTFMVTFYNCPNSFFFIFPCHSEDIITYFE